ncbi:hypothetical protein TthAA37_15670 [Thermus thermophilus]|uniref:Uncharacterized protein n=2 Tax=Thermus thermophilus TaxID=274 RepID=A0AAD1KUW6_THETH|nr:hypothetical protein TthAA220_14860 [Thermus thermophilus]BBL85001.1 hypothetical protein TthAA229_14820 [Thermus thermophilus]BCZ87365.1 hypothetical protein TthAA11_15470 [Thermus thermophilus]BCZ89726.1 hypothetical protein TthAA22_15310 [Thermus thermophilus]BCZ92378.1 hypothetical protein TthAA37_15670 [Thermus thermophilus]
MGSMVRHRFRVEEDFYPQAHPGPKVHRDPEGGRFLVARGETIAPSLLPQAEPLFQPPL